MNENLNTNMNHNPPSTLLELTLCWSFYILGVFLNNVKSIFLFLELGNINDLIFHLLQNSALILSITVSFVTLYKFIKEYKRKKRERKKF